MKKKQKDPAFLFYSKDFYEGTRMMLPEERACYIDLLIYQHQNNGIIPNDLKRLMMYCSGVSEETIRMVLDKKFIQTVNGWFNQKLDQMVKQRAENNPKKIASACLAGLISHSNLRKKQKENLKKQFQISQFIEENGELITDESIIKTRVRDWFNELVDHLVDKRIENVNAIVNKIKEQEGGSVKGETKPVIMPWNNDQFFKAWEFWKDYRLELDNFSYKTSKSEQTALNELSNKAGGELEIAIAIIAKSVSNQWKGLFKLKKQENEQFSIANSEEYRQFLANLPG